MKTTSPRFSIRLRSAAGVVLLLWAAGCSSKGSVTGKVFYKDKPLPGGEVLLSHPQLGIVRSRIDADGSYQFANILPAEVKIAVMGPPTQQRGSPLPQGSRLGENQSSLARCQRRGNRAEVGHSTTRPVLSRRDCRAPQEIR